MKLLFYKGRRSENPSATTWDRIISIATRSRFSHVELSVYSSGDNYTCWSSSIRDKGVRCVNIKNDKNRWEVVDISKKVSSEWFIPYIGAPYDYVGLLAPILGNEKFSSNHKWFCSEIIAEALGLEDSWKYTPEDLYRKYA